LRKGRNGKELHPYYSLHPPTKKQIELIETLVEEFRAEGGDCWYADDCAWKKSGVVAYQLAQRLIKDKANYEKDNGLRPGEWKFVNLCRNRATGKTIRYVTSVKWGYPKGYEFLGQVGTKFVVEKISDG
jgi:hypothetical protein